MKFQHKLIILITLYIAVFVLITTIYYANDQKKKALTDLEDRSATLVKILSISSSTQLFWGNYDRLNQYAQKIKETFPVNFVAIVDYDGKVIAHTDRRKIGSSFEFPKGLDALGSRDVRQRYRPAPGSTFAVSYPVFILDKVVGYIIMQHDTTAMELEIVNIFLRSLYLAIGLALIGVVIAVYTGYRITKPVNKVMEGMDRIASGEFDHKILIEDRTEEFVKLARAFNNMGQRLKTTIQNLDEEKSQSEAIITSISDGLMLIDTERRVRFLNKGAEQILGYTNEEARHKACHEIFNNELCSTASCSLFNIRREPGSDDGALTHALPHSDRRIRITNKQGRIVTILKSAATLVNTQGEVYGGVEVFKDITDLLAMESKLKQADRLASMGILAAGMAHEINNPIAGIVGLATALLKDVKGDPVLTEDVTMIKEQGERCGRIISDLMKLALNSPKQLKATEVNAILGRTARLIRKSHPDMSLRITENYDTRNPVIRCDEGQLMQVFTNIIRNAVAATGEQGALEISTRLDGQKVEIVFADNGEGIPEANIARVFDPFFTTKKVGEGMGLGMAVSHGIVTIHGGEIRIESRVGAGAKFIIEMETVSGPRAGCANNPADGGAREIDLAATSRVTADA